MKGLRGEAIAPVDELEEALENLTIQRRTKYEVWNMQFVGTENIESKVKV
jgi:hypothetical protein